MIAQMLRLKHVAVVLAVAAPLLWSCGVGGLVDGLASGLTIGAGASGTGNFPIAVDEIYLNPEDTKQIHAGVLEYRAGYVLSTRSSDFGGLSGLILSPDGKAITAVTDHGNVLRAKLILDETGRLLGLDGTEMFRLRDVRGGKLSRRLDKRDQDTEALTRLADGSYLVSFEIRHRILHYENLTAKPTTFATPTQLHMAPRNGGLEAMTALPDGRIMIMTEKLRAKKIKDKAARKKDYIGWLLSAEGKTLGKIYWPRQGKFRPTDLAAMPNGDVLMLQRRYSAAGGAGARVSMIHRDQIKVGMRMADIELANLAPPLSVDNFEGLAVYPASNGGWWIYMLSDDNFNPLQRTLLLQFYLPKE